MNSQSKERKGIYWGYPWDIHSPPTRMEDGTIKIQAAFADYAFDTPDDQSEPGVAILFDGIATQGPPTGEFDKLKAKLHFMSMKEILSRYAEIANQSRAKPKKKISARSSGVGCAPSIRSALSPGTGFSSQTTTPPPEVQRHPALVRVASRLHPMKLVANALSVIYFLQPPKRLTSISRLPRMRGSCSRTTTL